MAGYICNLDNLEALKTCIENGVYSTKLSPPTNHWKKHHEGTFADYATMKSGDNIYFFIKRKIYGIGELVNIGDDCKLLNFPNASEPETFDYTEKRINLLWDEGPHSINQRWLCTFKPAPNFFVQGIDMDDVLSSNPYLFRMLRAFWKVSFIKLDDLENQALKNALLKYNQDSLSNPILGQDVFETLHNDTHAQISTNQNSHYKFGIAPIMRACSEADKLKHEMAIEAGILFQLSTKEEETIRIFGEWDYLSHQVVASPFKAIDYMDKMDIFGYSYIPGFKPTIANYLVCELKKDIGHEEDVDQLLKYVDWVKDEYCFGDYSPVKSYLIAYDFDDNATAYARDNVKRLYTLGRRPAKSLIWKDLSLVKYRYSDDDHKIMLQKIT